MRLHSRLSLDPSGDIIFKRFSNNALLWGEDKCWTIWLKGCLFNYWSVIEGETLYIMY